MKLCIMSKRNSSDFKNFSTVKVDPSIDCNDCKLNIKEGETNKTDLPSPPFNDNLQMENECEDITLCQHCIKCNSSSSTLPLGDISNKLNYTGRELVSVIRKGKFDEFINILNSKPNVDLNTFFNGNTALHHCLLLGKFSQ